jgi:hypothetical protein
MQTLKQGMAAIMLVATLGLVVPSTLGGSASADIPPNPTDHNDHRPYVETTFDCDLDGVEGYETPYELVSTFSSTMWQDKNSTTVLVQRLRVDVLDSFYTVLDDPTGTAVDFADPDVYWSDVPQDYPNGKPKGWQTVRCTEVVSYEYTATADDLIDAPHLPFVFIPDDPETEEDEEKAATYLETDTNLYDVTIDGNGPKANAAGANDVSGTDRQGKAKKQGKHKGKGKRGR